MIERTEAERREPKAESRKPGAESCFCNVCSHQWSEVPRVESRFRSIDDLVRRVNVRRDEVAMLAEIGALNSLGHDRRSAMWQVERAIRPAGELFEASIREPLARTARWKK
jgi:hypothetical protein